jgi:hypothetical protein
LNSDWDIFAFQKNEKKKIIVFGLIVITPQRGTTKNIYVKTSRKQKKQQTTSQKCPFTHTLCNETLFEKIFQP